MVLETQDYTEIEFSVHFKKMHTKDAPPKKSSSSFVSKRYKKQSEKYNELMQYTKPKNHGTPKILILD